MIFNSHTHIGDSFIKLPDKKWSVEELVAPGYGYKHRMLERAKEDEIVKGMIEAIKLMEKNTDVFVDFREGGIKGIKLLHKAMEGRKIKAIIMGRPAGMKYVKDEVDEILKMAHGIGLSSISDWDDREIEKIAEHVKKREKMFSIHVSEVKREDIDAVLSLAPDFIIHMCKGSKKDFEKIADENIPVVICPRANSFFGIAPKINEMMAAGIKIFLGTDNAMIVKPDVMEEMRYVIDKFGIDEEKAFEMISTLPYKFFKGKF